jgi:hypothetical protein
MSSHMPDLSFKIMASIIHRQMDAHCVATNYNYVKHEAV